MSGVRNPDPLAPLGDWLAETMPKLKDALLSPEVGKAAGQAVAGPVGASVGESLYSELSDRTGAGRLGVAAPKGESVSLTQAWAVEFKDGSVGVFPEGTRFLLVRQNSVEVPFSFGNVRGTVWEELLEGAKENG